MSAVWSPGSDVLASLPCGVVLDPHSSIREPEGLWVVLAGAETAHLKPPIHDHSAWLTLMVHSGLQAVGLIAAFRPPICLIQ